MYVEQNCTFTSADGKRSVEATGAYIAPDRAIGYLAETVSTGHALDHTRLYLTDWHGTAVLGNARIVASWKTPRNTWSSRMYQVEVILSGVTYTGRSNGVGMVWQGKPKRGK